MTMADKQRFVGPSGAVFVPRVDPETIARRVESGEWRPYTENAEKTSPHSRGRRHAPAAPETSQQAEDE